MSEEIAVLITVLERRLNHLCTSYNLKIVLNGGPKVAAGDVVADLDLLRHGGELVFLETVEFIETTPGAGLDQTLQRVVRVIEMVGGVMLRVGKDIGRLVTLCVCCTYLTVKMRPMLWKSMPSSQLNTSTCLPMAPPSAFTDSVLPVPAGP
jgi:hypothetical protein